MKILYLDCGMGAAGDMLTAALLELFPDPAAMLEKLNALGLPDVKFSAEPSVKCGITGTHVSVAVHGTEEGAEEHEHEHDHDHEHEHEHEHEHGGHTHTHHGIKDIEHIVKSHTDLPENVRNDVLKVFGSIAEAESSVHGVPVTEIHFHEVGTMDAVADVTAVCYLMHELSPDKVVASPVHTGSGHVKCAHGILPVPAPATAYLLQGIPSYGGGIQGELCTPTGAALLKHFVDRFGDMPVMSTSAIGYGMGKKDFQTANCVRAMLGESANESDTVTELSFNVDDMTAEAVGYASAKLFEGGALEVYTLPAGMKKGRPGTLVSVLCRPDDEDKIVRLIFKHTSTIGVRKTSVLRYVLGRETETVQTRFGPVRKKVSTGYGVRREKYEYDDVARIADEQGTSMQEVLRLLKETE